MIANKAYNGKNLVYRAYYNGQLIWDYGVYGHGNAFASLSASIMPYLKNQDAAKLCAEAIMDGLGMADVSSPLSILANTDVGLKSNVRPHSAKTVHSIGTEFITAQATIAPFTFDIVYAYGDTTVELEVYGCANEATSVHGLGITNISIVDSVCPTVEDVMQIFAPLNMDIADVAIPKVQEPEQLIVGLPSDVISNCSPSVLPIHTVTFMRDGTELYRTKVVHGYACTDPVAAGIIETPTKAMTVQYTYEFSGWSLTDGGEAEYDSKETLLENYELTTYLTPMGVYGYYIDPAPFHLTAGETYSVIWNEDKYDCVAIDGSAIEPGAVFIGNATAFGLSGNGEPFIIGGTETSPTNVYSLNDTEETVYTVSVYHQINGALSNITEDTVVYVAFKESIRYYTVRFFDGDTLVDTVSVPYGGTAVTSYIKPGYESAWEPSNENITGDTDCYGRFEEVTFANSTWDEIAEISESGQASQYFKVGDTKTINVNNSNVQVAIAGFNHDDLSDGSGKTGMTIVCMNVPAVTTTWRSSQWGNYDYGGNLCNVTNQLSSWYNQFPTELKSNIKEVSKQCDSTDNSGTSPTLKTLNCKLFCLSATELGYDNSSYLNNVSTLGSRYELFPLNTRFPTVTKVGTTTRVGYWLRQRRRLGTYAAAYCTSSGSLSNTSGSNLESQALYIRFGFCI